MKLSQPHISSQGKIALPLIILSALCFLDQLFNAVDVVRPSSYVYQGLSFPMGWLICWLGRLLTQIIAPRHDLAAASIVFIAAFVGSVLNIYLLAAAFVFLSRNRRSTHETSVGDEEFKTLLDEHHKDT